MSDPVVALLEDVRRHMEPPARDADPVAGAMTVIRSSPTVRGRRRWTTRAAAAMVAIAGVLALPPARTAVADLLGLGGVSIERNDTVPADLGTELDLGTPVSLEEAGRSAPGPLPVPAGLPDATAAFAGVPRGGVTLVWAADDRLTEVGDTGVGLLVSAWPEPDEHGLVIKALGPGTTVEPVGVGDASGYFIGGAPHAIEFTGGQVDRPRLAANTLLWSRDGVVYRLESSLDRDAALALAESIAR